MVSTYPQIRKMSPQFVVANLERSLDFYTQVLGFEVDFIYDDFYAGVINDDFTIHLKLGNPLPEQRANQSENEHLDLVFSVVGIHDLFEAMKNRSATVVQPLREMPYGTEFYIADPDGYILGFLE